MSKTRNTGGNAMSKGEGPTQVFRRKKTQTRRWLVFYTRARAEKKVERRLREAEIDVFLPTCIVKRQWSDRIKKVELPLFPNYIFARVNEKERIKVLRTNGIATIVTFRGKPAELPEETIQQLKFTQKDPETLERLSDQRPPLGSKVKVTSGPMEGLTGHILEHRGEINVVVQVEAIQQAVKVSLSNAEVEEL